MRRAAPAPRPSARRRFLLGSGPLKRGSDRVEAASRVLLAATVLAAGPAGIAVGIAEGSSLATQAATEAATRHEVQATLLADARGDAASGVEVPTSAVWAAPDGSVDAGTVPAPAGTHTGAGVTVWIDEHGTVVEAPHPADQVVAESLVLGAATAVAMLLTAGTVHLVVRRLLARQRDRRWTAGWAAVEPLWVSRSS
jgi:hypothetical protein